MNYKPYAIVLIVIFLISSSVTLSAVGSEITVTEETYYEFYSYPNMTKLIHELQENHSDIMSIESIGQTYEGRDIWMVKLSDNVEIDENEPGILLMGAHHGNEKPSYEVLIHFIKHAVEFYNRENNDDDNDGLINEDEIDGIDNDNDGRLDEDPSEERVRKAIDNTQIYIIPMVNPDGVEANTRKNRRPIYNENGDFISYGVDPNRNYGFRWNLYKLFPKGYNIVSHVSDDPKDSCYRGEYPFSENETKAVKEFVETHQIKISISYHTSGREVWTPWIHNCGRTPHHRLFVSIGKEIAKINNYTLEGKIRFILPLPIGSIGESEDWLYGEHRILAFLIELDSPYDPPEVIQRCCHSHIGVNLFVCEQSQTIKVKKIGSLNNIFFTNSIFSKFLEK